MAKKYQPITPTYCRKPFKVTESICQFQLSVNEVLTSSSSWLHTEPDFETSASQWMLQWTDVTTSNQISNHGSGSVDAQSHTFSFSVHSEFQKKKRLAKKVFQHSSFVFKADKSKQICRGCDFCGLVGLLSSCFNASSIRRFTVSPDKEITFRCLSAFPPTVTQTILLTAGNIRSSAVVCGFPDFAISFCIFMLSFSQNSA